MRALLLLLCLAGCGRFGFAPAEGGGSEYDAGIDASSSGPVGPRWITWFEGALSAKLVGTPEGIASILSFSSTLTGDGVTVMAPGSVATALMRWDASGGLVSATAVYSDVMCDLRGIASDGTDLVLAGFAQASQALPEYGACGVVSSRQDPIVVRIDPTGQQSVLAQFDAVVSNAQAWTVAMLSDHSAVVSGIYGSSLTIGSGMLPTANFDPSLWLARSKPGAPTDAVWSRTATDTAQIHAGPIAADGDETCVLGAFSSPSMVLGTDLPHVGNYDAFVARLDPAGNARFVRAIGSTAGESMFNDGSIIALPDGGCMVGIDAPGDVTLETTISPASDGSGLAVRFAATGAVVSARRFAREVYVARVGDRVIGAHTVTAPLTIGTTPYTPVGSDVVFVEIGATPQDDVLLGAIAGAGDQTIQQLAAVSADAVGFATVNVGALSFGSRSFDSGATMVRMVGVLGL